MDILVQKRREQDVHVEFTIKSATTNVPVKTAVAIEKRLTFYSFIYRKFK